jgi:hypothetical protein
MGEARLGATALVAAATHPPSRLRAGRAALMAFVRTRSWGDFSLGDKEPRAVLAYGRVVAWSDITKLEIFRAPEMQHPERQEVGPTLEVQGKLCHVSPSMASFVNAASTRKFLSWSLNLHIVHHSQRGLLESSIGY